MLWETRALCTHAAARSREPKKERQAKEQVYIWPLFPSSFPLRKHILLLAKMFVAYGREDFGERPAGSRQKNTQQWRLRGGCVGHFLTKAQQHTHTFAWTTGRKREREGRRKKVRERESGLPWRSTSCSFKTAICSKPSTTHFNSDLQVLEKSCESQRRRSAFAEGGWLRKSLHAEPNSSASALIRGKREEAEEKGSGETRRNRANAERDRVKQRSAQARIRKGFFFDTEWSSSQP